MPRKSIVDDGLRVNLGEDDVRMIMISCGMLSLKINSRGWWKYHMSFDGDIMCIWDAESNLEGVQI